MSSTIAVGCSRCQAFVYEGKYAVHKWKMQKTWKSDFTGRTIDKGKFHLCGKCQQDYEKLLEAFMKKGEKK